MTALENKIQELWFLVISPVEMEKEIKAKCQAINILGGNVNVEGMLSLAKKVQPLAKNCYDLEIPMEKILESIPEDLGDDLIDDLSWHLQSLREDVESRIQSVDEELDKLHSALWLTQNDIKESLAKISDGLIPAHIDTLVHSKYGCMSTEFADQVFVDLRGKTVDSGVPELKIDDLRFQMSSDGKEIISDPVTYHFVCGGTDEVVSRASFYDAVLNANLISLKHGLQPVYELVIWPEIEKESADLIPYLEKIVSGDLNPQNLGTALSEEEIEKLRKFFYYNFHLGSIRAHKEDLEDDEYSYHYSMEGEEDSWDYDPEDEYLHSYFNINKIEAKIKELMENEKQGFKSFMGEYNINVRDTNGYQLISLKCHEDHPPINKDVVDLVCSDRIYPDISFRNNLAYYEGCDCLVASTKEPETHWSPGYNKKDKIFGFRLKRKI